MLEESVTWSVTKEALKDNKVVNLWYHSPQVVMFAQKLTELEGRFVYGKMLRETLLVLKQQRNELKMLINPGPAVPEYACLCKQHRSRSVGLANWSGSALFVIKYVNLHQQHGSSNLIGWKLEEGTAS